ncbi:hypothetical protein [Bradyrhizobium sp. AS23.2]|uniref:hypothetical protein n=1 Tax=Bradyrhizobium sp. AS23.2 TaxID=1680155 RepID=UPI00095A688D|nr:hypothetical protein [Bradyrhizobium sp. AS23.2]OKO73415.1 hypothetical protein AC630_28970 [Bradyrhizobium sp. AS23.2]
MVATIWPESAASDFWPAERLLRPPAALKERTGRAIGAAPGVFFRQDSHVDQCDCFIRRGGFNVSVDRSHVILRGILDVNDILDVHHVGDLVLAPGLSPSVRDRRLATSARVFKALERSGGAELSKLHRTFGCGHRHIGVGDFSAQCLNGRRQAMIFRLRGVALFQDQFEAYQPSGNGMNGQAVWLSFAAFGDSWTEVLTSASGVERTARRRHAHCKFIAVASTGQFFSKIPILFKLRRLFKIAARSHGALILKSRMHSRKIGAGFQPVSPLRHDK